MNLPALIFWALIAWSFTARPSTLLVLLLASIPFASLSLVSPSFTAGMTLLPQMMFAVVLILKVLAPHVTTLSPKFLSSLQVRHLGSLAAFLLIGAVVTAIMPRLFGGEVVILPMRTSWIPELLSPSQANFTQFGYVALSVMTVFAVTLMKDEPGFTSALLTGLRAGGTVCVVSGLVDLAAASTGMESLLDPLRNAEYAYLTNDALAGGVRRVVGFTPEASAFGPICVEFAAAISLLRPLYAEGRQRVLATVVAVSLVVMAMLSTSSTAYAGLAVLGLVYAANWIRRAAFSSLLGQSGLVGELLTGIGLIVTLLLILVVRGDLFNPLINVINEIIFDKPMTSSYFERSHWNAVAWDSIASTWGLGIGFGATRTSSWFVAIVSNTGLLGAAVIGFFLLQTLCRQAGSRTPLSDELLPALKLSLFPALAMLGVDAPGPDFGPWMAVIFGAIAAIAAFHPVHSSVGDVGSARPMTRRTSRRKAIGSRASGRTLPAVYEDGVPDKLHGFRSE